MGIKDLLEVIRLEALNRLMEEKRRRRERLKFRSLTPKGEGRKGRLERREKLL